MYPEGKILNIKVGYIIIRTHSHCNIKLFGPKCHQALAYDETKSSLKTDVHALVTVIRGNIAVVLDPEGFSNIIGRGSGNERMLTLVIS